MKTKIYALLLTLGMLLTGFAAEEDRRSSENWARAMFLRAVSALKSMPTTPDTITDVPAWLVPVDSVFPMNTFLRFKSLHLAVLLWGEIMTYSPESATAKYMNSSSNPLKLEVLTEELDKLKARFGSGFRVVDPVLGAAFSLVHAGHSTFSDSGERILISKSFFVQQTEVTQQQYQNVMGTQPSYFSDCGEDCPVENVSWDEVQNFLAILNNNPHGARYRLPTEAEWDYLHSIAESPTAMEAGGVMPVSSLTSDKLGLRGIIGNVWEMTSDSFEKNFPRTFLQTTLLYADPQNTKDLRVKVIKGGGYDSDLTGHPSRLRQGVGRNSNHPNVGLRLVLEY